LALTTICCIINLGDSVDKKKVKKGVKIISSIVIISIIALIILYGYISYTSTVTYKLKELGYSEEEINVLTIKLDTNKLDDILTMEYNEYLTSLLNEKYFIYNYLDRYTNYKRNNIDKSIEEVVEIINTNRDYEYYTNIQNTDMSLEDKIIVNKYYQLDSSYVPDNLVNVSLSYAYSGVKISEHVYSAFKELAKAAKKEGHTIVISSGYRSYETQESIYNKRKDKKGKEYADAYVAHPGHSEHQTGLAIDIADFKNSSVDFSETASYQWMLDNAYKYGFILRYPKDKENITGYNFESWHYRYVGYEIAKDIHELGITYDEYYTYYIGGNDE